MLIAALLALMAISVGGGGRTASATHLCGNTGSPKGAFNLQSYEHSNWRLTYSRTFALAGYNRLFSGLSGFALPRLETGGRSAGSGQLADPYIPPRVLKAIAWIESSWTQAAASVPYGEIGPVLVSHDCGYGLMQVTSGMQNTTGVPSTDQAMIGGHYAFNIARGARILAQKWNLAPEYRPIVGQRGRKKVENWYYALWSYNGFAYKNHPLNPAYPFPRSAYRCDGSQSRSNYPYQELVYGCMKNPPEVEGQALWNPLSATLPSLSNPAFNLANWNSCSSNNSCAGMDITTPTPSHTDSANTSLTRAQVIGSPNISASPGNISISAVHGGKSQQVSLTISNPGSGLLSVQVTPSKSWLRVSRRQGVALGSDLGAKNLIFTIRGVATSIPAGTHTATVNIKSLYPSKTVTVNVTFRVFELPDGTVISASTPRWLMRGGQKRLIPNQITFEVNRFDSEDVVKVPSSLPSTIPSGQPLLDALADGNLLTAPGFGVYVMDGGSRRLIKNENVFSQCGYGWGAVQLITSSGLKGVAKGPDLAGQPCPKLSPPSGSLLHGTGPGVYVMRNGLKRHIPNPLTLDAEGLRWSDRNIIADSALAAIPTGDPLMNALADGNLLTGSSTAAFVMEGGVRRHVSSAAVLATCGYTWDAVRTVSDGQLERIAEGPSLSGPPCPRLSPAGGSLVRGSGSPVYMMQKGLKRHVPNLETFEAEGFRWGNVNVIADSSLAGIPAGDALLNALADGNLLTGSGSAVYVIEGGERRHVTSPSAMDACGYGWDALREISDSRLNDIPVGPSIAGPPCPIVSPPSGNLIRNGVGGIYIVLSGIKRPVPNTLTFEAQGFLWGNVNQLPDSTVGAIPTGDSLLSAYADGNLLKDSGTSVYVMEGGVKRLVKSTAVMTACGYGWDAVQTVIADRLAAVQSGLDLSGPPCPSLSISDGKLIQGDSSAVFVMEAGKRRLIASTKVFDDCGYLWGNVNPVVASVLEIFPIGDPVKGEPCP